MRIGRWIDRLVGANDASAAFRYALSDHEEWIRSDGRRGTKADFSKLNLSRYQMRGALLSKSDLSYCNLTSVYAPHACFDSANLESVSFENATLIQSSFKASMLLNSRCSNANFALCDMRSVRANGGNFQGAKFDQADVQSSDFGDVNLSSSRLLGANLSGSNLMRAMASGADFSRANLWRSNCSYLVAVGSRFVGAQCYGAQFAEADFSNSDLFGASFVMASLCSAKFARANLSGTDFRGANLAGVDFSEADLSGALGVIDAGTVNGSRVVAYMYYEMHHSLDLEKRWIEREKRQSWMHFAHHALSAVLRIQFAEKNLSLNEFKALARSSGEANEVEQCVESITKVVSLKDVYFNEFCLY